MVGAVGGRVVKLILHHFYFQRAVAELVLCTPFGAETTLIRIQSA